jgi:acyl-CoA synthetase (NDP forming)
MDDQSQNVATTDYERIFHPQRIAIIGVSAEEGSASYGNRILNSLQSIGYSGEILLVGRKGGNYAGFEIYKQIEDIPGNIDFAVVCVGAKVVADTLESCRKKGAAGAQILSAGFSELGTQEGKDLEIQIQKVAMKGIRVIGPNCFGVYCPKGGLTMVPGPDLSRESGNVAFLSQSGGMAIDFSHTGKWMGMRFSKVVSFGNGADLRETELLHHLGEDPETHVIAMYIEGVKDGDAFEKEIKSVTRKKPVIVYKGGLSDAGQRAVVSHTASMGGNKVIWPAVLRHVNAVQVQDMEEMAHATLVFSLLPERGFKGISVIGGGGALGVTACDAAEYFNINIPPFSLDLRKRIESLLPQPGSSAGNPIDVATPFFPPQTLKEVLRLAAEDDRVDLQIVVSLLYHYKARARAMGKSFTASVPYNELADGIQEVVKDTNKPVVVVLPNPKRGLDDMDSIEILERTRLALLQRGVPVFDELRDALRAIGHVNTYYERKKANNE